MATVTALISALPQIWQMRYSSRFVGWTNDLLKDLSLKKMMPEIKVDRGVIVSRKVFIDLPSEFRSIINLSNPEDRDQKYRAEQIASEDGLPRLRLVDHYQDDISEYQLDISTFSNFATDGITVDLDGYDADELYNYLLVLNSGTYSGKTYIIGGNSASSGGETDLEFMHDMKTALDDTKAVAGYLIGPDYYLMMRYWSGYSDVSALDDEVPIDDNIESIVAEPWYMWKIYENVDVLSKETAYWKGQYEDKIHSVQTDNRPMEPVGRRLVGFLKGGSTNKSHPDYSEFL